jgi:DHA1 family tetracycline resistance protein-like MFS transporter
MSTTPRAFDIRPLVAANAICMSALMAFVAVVGPITRSLGLPEWAAGLAITVAGVLWMLLARPWGAASDRHGRRSVLVAGIAGFALAYLALAIFVDSALAHTPAALVSIAALVGGRAVMGAFFAGVQPTLMALVADNVPGERRAGAMAKLGAGGAAGLMIGPAVAGLIALYDLAWPMYIAALLPWIALVLLLAMLPRRAPGAARAAAGAIALFDRRLALPMAAAFTAMLSVGIAQVTIGFFVLDRLGMPPEQGARAAGTSLTAVGIALIVAQAFVVRFKSVQPRQWMLYGSLLASGGFAATAFSTSEPMLLTLYFAAAFGMGFLFPGFQSAAANVVAAHERGAAAGSISSAQGLGMAVGPLLGTFIYALGPAAPYFAIAAVLAILAALVARSSLAARVAPQELPSTPRR